MINFVNTGLDDRILKSMPVENVSEDLEKAMNRQGLVQKEVMARGKHGTFIRKQWVRVDDIKKPGSSHSKSTADEVKKRGTGRKALNSLQSMKGWKEDGLATGKNDNDTYYAVSHDFDDVNGKIFTKTTVGNAIDGNIDGGKEMTAQEVLDEVKKRGTGRK